MQEHFEIRHLRDQDKYQVWSIKINVVGVSSNAISTHDWYLGAEWKLLKCNLRKWINNW